MIVRVIAIFGLGLAFAGSTAAVAQTLDPAPTPPAVSEPATAVPPVPVAPEPAAEAPAIVPSPAETAPAVAVTPPAPQAPVVTAPVTPTPAPVVTAPTPMPPEKPAMVEDKKEAEPAKKLFAAQLLPSLGKALAIGYYPRGCLQGGVPLPVTGPTWQVMRVSRNRNWGHPSLVKFLEKFAPLAAKATGWKGILVGDMAQPRGGPLPFGHTSHQIGLDVDIWFMPMPDHTLSKDEREKISATNVVADDWKHLNPKTWTPQHIAFIKAAAEQPEVERVLVNAAIKQELCRVGGKQDWLAKVRPWYGHHDHIHVRLQCPEGSPNCRKQPPVPADDGCAKKALDYWFSDRVLHPKIVAPKKPPHSLTMADLPPACKTVLSAPAKTTSN